MSDEDTDDFELDGHALAMIAAYRQEESLPPAVHDRVWDRVEADVAPPVAPVSAVKWGVGLVAAAAAIAATVFGASTLFTEDERAAEQQQAPYGVTGEPEIGEVEAPALHVDRGRTGARGIEEPVPAIEPPAIEPPAPALVEAADATRGAKPRAHAAPRAARDDATRNEIATPSDADTSPPESDTTAPDGAAATARGTATPAPADTLTAELRMLDKARNALAAKRPTAALAILDAYAREFPSPRLGPERAALRVIALCDAGRSDEGAKAADAFLAAHSGHALASRVRRACDR